MHDLISLALLVIGLILLFSVDTIIAKDTSNNYLKTIYDNKNIAGSVCIAGAYYVYVYYVSQLNNPVLILPSYNESMATSDVLNL